MFKWSDTFSVNNEEIDKQHIRLFEIGSEIYELASLKDGYDHYDEIINLLNDLKDYTIYHFDYEEKLMQQIGYKELDVHKIEHMFFVKKLQRIEKKDFDQDQGETLIQLINFIADWISSHILKSDMSYRQCLSETNAK